MTLAEYKKTLVKPTPKVTMPRKIRVPVMKWDIVDEIRKGFGMKTNKERQKRRQTSPKWPVRPALMWP